METVTLNAKKIKHLIARRVCEIMSQEEVKQCPDEFLKMISEGLISGDMIVLKRHHDQLSGTDHLVVINLAKSKSQSFTT